jgi:hypothetical protein
MTKDDLKIGDAVTLKTYGYNGWRNGKVIGFSGLQVIVELSSGKEVAVYPDEIEDKK